MHLCDRESKSGCVVTVLVEVIVVSDGEECACVCVLACNLMCA